MPLIEILLKARLKCPIKSAKMVLVVTLERSELN